MYVECHHKYFCFGKIIYNTKSIIHHCDVVFKKIHAHCSVSDTRYWCEKQLRKKQYNYLEVDTWRAENQVDVIDHRKEYLIWKKTFLIQKYKAEKLHTNELHAAKMRVLKLKERKIMNED